MLQVLSRSCSMHAKQDIVLVELGVKAYCCQGAAGCDASTDIALTDSVGESSVKGK